MNFYEVSCTYMNLHVLHHINIHELTNYPRPSDKLSLALDKLSPTLGQIIPGLGHKLT